MSLLVDKRGEKKMSGDTEKVYLEKITSEMDAFDFGKVVKQEKVITWAVLVLEQIQIEEKASLDQLEMEFIVHKTREFKLSDDAKRIESKKEFGQEKGVSVHETEISLAVVPVQEKRRRLT